MEERNASLPTADRLTRRELRRLENLYAERLRLMQLKLFAGILDVDLGELTRRDAEARARRLQRIVSIAAIVVLMLAGFAAWAWWNGERAQHAANLLHLQLSARVLQETLASGDQGTVLRQAIADVQFAEQKLHRIPVETWNTLFQSLEASRELRRWETPGQLMNLGFSDDHQSITGVMRDGEVITWNWGGELQSRWRAATNQFEAWMTASRRAVWRTVGADTGERVEVFTFDGALAHAFEREDGDHDILVDTSANAEWIVYSTDGRTVRRTSRRPGGTQVLEVAGFEGPLADLRLARDGTRVLLVDGLGHARIQPADGSAGAPVDFQIGTGGPVSCSDHFDLVASVSSNAIHIASAPDYRVRSASLGLTDRPGIGLATPERIHVYGPPTRVAISFENQAGILVFDEFGKVVLGPLLGIDQPSFGIPEGGVRLVGADYVRPVLMVYDLEERAVQAIPNDERTLSANDAVVTAAAYNSPRETLIWAGSDGRVRLVRAEGSSQVLSALPAQNLVCLAAYREGFLGSGDQGRTWFVPDLEAPVPTELEGRGTSFHRLATLEKSGLALGIAGAQLVVWRPEQAVTPVGNYDLKALTAGRMGFGWRLAVAADSQLVAITGEVDQRSAVTLWSFDPEPTLKSVISLPELSTTESVALDAQGTHIVVSGAFDTVVILDRQGNRLKTLRGVLRPFASSFVFVQPDVFAAASMWGEVQFWRSNGERLLTGLKSHVRGGGPVHLAYNPASQDLWLLGLHGDLARATLDNEKLLRRAHSALHKERSLTGPPRQR
ncbi:MAG: hypothetical protein IT580_13440 [Verrucomicrobiales bacterium]|nr:hypothetical protein [Verrucomicrobiales bacterium]